LLLDPLILVGSILHLIVVYYLIRFGILAEIVGLQKIRINRHSSAPEQVEPTPRCDPGSLGMAQTSSTSSRVHA
ncbi:hypothetical protein PIB30_107073, partial [Stylosanthes scabra]|nr:hypothetical protein [Stylosanthes scabra]